MPTLAARAKRFREKKGLSQSELARRIGVTAQAIQKLEAGGVEAPRYIVKLAKELEVDPVSLQYGDFAQPTVVDVRLLKVMGTAEAGAFRDISLVDEIPEEDLLTIPVVQDARFEHAQQYALKLVGDSMNLVYPDGCFLMCARWGDIGHMLPKPGMRLHVERHSGHLIETTVKEYIQRDGVGLLTPRSTNPAHKEIPILDNDETQFVIRGLVIGQFIQEPMV